jgi:PHD/YefM family antitoxin component YafN of YafNO toxin-antitoxin module
VHSAAAVVIKASDVAMLQEELDLTKDAAEALLRRARGDPAAALSAYIQGAM